MDFANKIYAQSVDLYRSMTPGARVISVLLLGMVLASAVYLFNQQVAPANAFLMNGEMFSASQLRDMHAALGQANLQAQIDGARIKVPVGQESKYMAALADANALPVDFGDYLKKAVSTNTFMVSRSQQEEATRVANQLELQNILNHMNGVAKAAVHVDREMKRGFGEKNIITASVNIVPRGTQPLEESRIPTIKNLVASYVAGLKPEAVTVVDLSSGVSYAGNGGDGRSPAASGEYADLQKRYERDFQEKIKNLLAIPGLRVTVGVAFASALAHEEHTEDPETQAPNLDRVAREERLPRRVTASIAVPNTYYEKIWRQQNSGSENVGGAKAQPADLELIETAEKRKIEESVIAILPKPVASADADKLVAVSTFYDFPGVPLPEPTLESRVVSWLAEYWGTLCLAGLAFVSLMVLRSMVKSAPVGPHVSVANESAHRLSALNEDTAGPFVDDAPVSRASVRTTGAPSLQSELADMVRNDPDAAASVLRNWIGAAS